ncbi:MAG: ribonuclease P protein component [Chloroflexaceae bacterium]
MKRVYRLRRPDQFRRVRREGRTYTSPHLTLNVAAGRRQRTRCGFVVSKQFGAAVRRNRARRRVREAVRLLLPSIVPGYDLVFIVRGAGALTVPFLLLQREIEQLLRRARLWSETAEQASPGEGVNPDPAP